MRERTVALIDLHCHILPDLDDGPRTMEDSIRMCQVGRQDGIETIVATPHILAGIYENERSTILSKVSALNTALAEFGDRSSELRRKDFPGSTQSQIDASGVYRVPDKDPITEFLNDAARQKSQSALSFHSALRARHSESALQSTIDPSVNPSAINLSHGNGQSSINILPGADVHFSSDLLERLQKKEIVTVNDQGRYLMIEFAFQGIPYQAEEVLFQLMSNGITPIISHPERNIEIGQRPQRYYEMVRMGCLGQVTAMSLTGEFGPGIKKSAEKLLAKRLIHFIASDAHSLNGRPPILSAGVKKAEKIVGKEEARKMVTEYPEAIIQGRRPDVPEPLSP